MREIMKALRGARLIAEGDEGGEIIRHYLLLNGKVLEIVIRKD